MRWYQETYVNKKLQIRLLELIYSHGLTELELCKILNMHYLTWNKLIKGVRRPTNNLINELEKILGKEVRILFLGYYIENKLPKLITAHELEKEKTSDN